MGADLCAQRGAAVQPYPGPTRRPVCGDAAGVGAELVGRVFGGDAALQRRTPQRDRFLGQPEIGQGFAGGDAQLGLHQIDVGDFFGYRMLHLNSRVHLDEDMVAAVVDQELHRSCAAVADLAGERDRVCAYPFAQHRIQVRRGRQFNDFLMTPLHRTVPFEKVDDVSRLIGEDLHLDVARVDHRLLEKHGRIPECRFGLSRSGFDRFAQLTALTDPAHSAAAAARDSFDEHGKLHLVSRREQGCHIRTGRRGRQYRQSRRLCRLDRASLIAGQCQHVGRGADEGDPRRFAGCGEIRVLRKEPVPGIDRVGAGIASRRHDLLDGQIRPHRMARRADLVAFVGLQPVHGVAVLVGIECYRCRAQLVCRAKRTNRNLTAIGDQDLGEHGENPSLGTSRNAMRRSGFRGASA